MPLPRPVARQPSRAGSSARSQVEVQVVGEFRSCTAALDEEAAIDFDDDDVAFDDAAHDGKGKENDSGDANTTAVSARRQQRTSGLDGRGKVERLERMRRNQGGRYLAVMPGARRRPVAITDAAAERAPLPASAPAPATFDLSTRVPSLTALSGRRRAARAHVHNVGLGESILGDVLDLPEFRIR